MNCTCTLSSGPPSGSTAISIIELRGDIDAALAALHIKPVATTRAVLRTWPDVDTLVISRPLETHALLFPHAGAAIIRRALNALTTAGIHPARSLDPRSHYPEAASLLEARMLDALARAQSPLAIDLLLDQPRRWALAQRDPSLIHSSADSSTLNRLIDPPLIVALGAPNIGKTSLLNALAGRGVAIVADEPGTTRDHVGVQLDLAGLVVRYVDTPGIGITAAAHAGRTDHAALDLQAQHIALDLAKAADLILLCSDVSHPPIALPADSQAPTLRIGLRADLGHGHHAADIRVSARTGQSLPALTTAIRQALIPDHLLHDKRAWTFWSAAGSENLNPAGFQTYAETPTPPSTTTHLSSPPCAAKPHTPPNDP